MPIMTARASQRRAPTMVSATAAAVASAALMPIGEEVDAARDIDLVAPEEVDEAAGQHGARGEQAEEGDGPLTAGGGPFRPLSDTTLPLLRHHVRVAIDFEGEGLLEGVDDRAGPPRAAAHARERGLHARGAARRGRAGPAGAAARRARAGRRGQALHPRGAGRGDRARLPISSTTRGACARGADPGARRARDHRGGARAVAQRQGRSWTRASRRRPSSSSPP